MAKSPELLEGIVNEMLREEFKKNPRKMVEYIDKLLDLAPSFEDQLHVIVVVLIELCAENSKPGRFLDLVGMMTEKIKSLAKEFDQSPTFQAHLDVERAREKLTKVMRAEIAEKTTPPSKEKH